MSLISLTNYCEEKTSKTPSQAIKKKSGFYGTKLEISGSAIKTLLFP